MPTDPNQPAKQTPPNQGSIAGKPVVKAVITPDQRDRIIVVRRDVRKGGYKVPKQGKPFKGVDEFKTAEGYVFATVQYSDPPGVWVDEYYLKSRADQERYNWTIEYPYVNKHYPKLTRTYVCLRSDYMVLKEPDADTVDPTSTDLYLTDHKIDRIENDPILDALFVKVIRVFERLPSPTIRSYEMNQFQQQVSTDVWEVVSGPPPLLAATIEKAMQERTGTAKAKNTSAAVPRVFPNESRKREIPSMTRELWLGGFQEVSDTIVEAGQVTAVPSLTVGQYSATGENTTEFKKKTTIQSLPLPQSRVHQEMVSDAGGLMSEIANEYLDVAPPGTFSLNNPSAVNTWTIDAHLRNLTDFGQVRKLTQLPTGVPWPILREEKVLTEGIYAGIKVLMLKQMVRAGLQPDGSGPPYLPNPGGFTDLIPHNKWKTIQITSSVDLTTLPKPITYAATHPLDIPPTLLTIAGICGDRGGSSSDVSNDGKNGESVTLATDSGPIGTISHTSREGFRGNAIAIITRIFLTAPPVYNGAGGITVIINGVPTTFKPIQFLGVTGTATIVSVYSRFTRGLNGDLDGTIRGSSHSNQGQIRTQTTELRPMLTGQFLGSPANITMIDARTGNGVPGNVFTGASVGVSGHTKDGKFAPSLFQPGNTCTLRVNVPLSTPAATPASGTQVLVAVDVVEWRFGIWVLHLVNAIVP